MRVLHIPTATEYTWGCPRPFDPDSSHSIIVYQDTSMATVWGYETMPSIICRLSLDSFTSGPGGTRWAWDYPHTFIAIPEIQE